MSPKCHRNFLCRQKNDGEKKYCKKYQRKFLDLWNDSEMSSSSRNYDRLRDERKLNGRTRRSPSSSRRRRSTSRRREKVIIMRTPLYRLKMEYGGYHKIKHFACHRDFFVHEIPRIKHTQNASFPGIKHFRASHWLKIGWVI